MLLLTKIAKTAGNIGFRENIKSLVLDKLTHNHEISGFLTIKTGRVVYFFLILHRQIFLNITINMNYKKSKITVKQRSCSNFFIIRVNKQNYSVKLLNSYS